MPFLTRLAILASIASTALAHPPFILTAQLASNTPLVLTNTPYLTLSSSSSASPVTFTNEHMKNTINSTTSSDILFLRPTHGTPQYYVKLGDPFSDSVPALTIWNNWSFESDAGKTYLSGSWWACGNGDETYSLYSGARAWNFCESIKLEVKTVPGIVSKRGQDGVWTTTSVGPTQSSTWNQTVTLTFTNSPTGTGNPSIPDEDEEECEDETLTVTITSTATGDCTTQTSWPGNGTTTGWPVHPTGTGVVPPVPTGTGGVAPPIPSGTGGVVVPIPTQPVEGGPEAPPSDGAAGSLRGGLGTLGMLGSVFLGAVLLL
ncbi:hypothetical protein BJ508DRAFT_323197 [Ascobolus immersus RN42]|uniref:Uncharacterized protein n=1 Tax=Ascobolus immersus RN42 TaxID=1160509 RepID=A0A3N4ILK2_ASCIM|nr:hypothetical protein BJ508DRAFT_323197 [Ascobolus immersus RN42]